MRTYGNASIWLEGRKLATFTTWDYNGVNSGEPIVNDDGWDGVSRGNNSSTLDVNEMTPVGGNGQDLATKMLRGTVLNITLAPVDGKRHSMPMICRSFNYKSDSSKRTLEGSFKFEGAPPTVSG